VIGAAYAAGIARGTRWFSVKPVMRQTPSAKRILATFIIGGIMRQEPANATSEQSQDIENARPISRLTALAKFVSVIDHDR